MWPFKKNKELCGIRSDDVGGLIADFTEEEEDWIDVDMAAFRGQGIRKDCYDEIMSSCIARSLATYSGSQERKAALTDDKASQKEYFDKAIAAIIKSYSIYPLPIYVYALARLFALANRGDIARGTYDRFLELQSQFSPSEIASTILAEWDVGEAIRTATSILGKDR